MTDARARRPHFGPWTLHQWTLGLAVLIAGVACLPIGGMVAMVGGVLLNIVLVTAVVTGGRWMTRRDPEAVRRARLTREARRAGHWDVPRDPGWWGQAPETQSTPLLVDLLEQGSFAVRRAAWEELEERGEETIRILEARLVTATGDLAVDLRGLLRHLQGDARHEVVRVFE